MAPHRRRSKRQRRPPSVFDVDQVAFFPQDWYFARLIYPLLVPARDYTWVIRGDAFSFTGVDLDAREEVFGGMLELPRGYATDTPTLYQHRHAVREEWNQIFGFSSPPDLASWSAASEAASTVDEREAFLRDHTELLLSIGEGNWCVHSTDDAVMELFVLSCPDVAPRPLRDLAMYH